MCGLAGFLTDAHFNREQLAPVAQAMAEAVRHRGPDDHGVWVDAQAGVALAHRRLSIVDLSPAGHQPMRSADGRYVIAYNGEIYNFAELRKSLEETGDAPAWRGHSDTEVLLATIAARGLNRALELSIGMFAFALWDTRERVLHLVHDRIGEKPLYYGWAGRTFVFGSELKALRMHPQWSSEIDRGVLALFMQYNCVPAPHTIYRGIFKLLRGHTLTMKADAKELTVNAYWSARDVAERGYADPFNEGEAEISNALDLLLRGAVGKQMVADVPPGAFLSGGIDSSTVAAMMQSQSTRPVKTFTIGFEEEGYNEAVHAAAIAKHLGTDHTELYVTPQQARDVIPNLQTIYDEPFADSSQIPTFLVSQLARSQVTVALSGDGGDELFAGYNRYVLAKRIWGRRAPLPAFARRLVSGALTTISPAKWDAVAKPLLAVAPRRLRVGQVGYKVHKLAEVLSHNSFEGLYRDLVSHWKPQQQIVLMDGEGAGTLDASDSGVASDPLAFMMLQDLLTYLPDDVLVKVDRAAMAVSLETRVPLLDHRVVEFAWRIPLSAKLNSGGTKSVLRNVLYRYVPKALVGRPKMGFGVPIDSWLRGPLKAWADDLLAPTRLRQEGFLNPEPIQQRWQEHQSGMRGWHYHLWDVLMFQAWLQANGN